MQIGFAADTQNFFPLQLQLFGQRADGFVQRVNLVVQICDPVLPAGRLLLQVREPSQQVLLLKLKELKCQSLSIRK